MINHFVFEKFNAKSPEKYYFFFIKTPTFEIRAHYQGLF